MKKTLIFMSMIIVLFMFSACGNDRDTDKKNASNNEPEPVSIKKQQNRSAERTEAKKDGPKWHKPDYKEQFGDYKITFVELGSVKCVPCKMMVPVMEEIDEKYGNEVNIVFHDVWTPEGRPFAKEYGIRGIPTQVFLDENGKEFHRNMGFYPKERIVEVLRQKGVNIEGS
ncbi:MAG: thioredoxin fold domain-containing protein [Candidatus Goldiibacteriota bacterium]